MTNPPGPAASPEQLRVELQRAVLDVVSTAHSVESAGGALLSAVGEALGWNVTALWVVDGEQIECVDAWSSGDAQGAEFAAASRGRRFLRGEGLPGRVWKDGTAQWIAELSADPAFPRASAARSADLHSGFAFPIRNVAGVVAVMECFSRQAQRPRADVLALAEEIGKQIGQFLQRLAAEARVREDEQRYAAIVNGALDAIIAIDQQGIVTEFNAAAQQLFGYTRDEALGREMAELIIPPDFREAHRSGLRRQRESGESHILQRRLELRACRRDGTEFPVELTISRFRVHGRYGFIGFLRDVTERQRYAEEREALLQRERDAHQAAAAANRLKDEFLAALSHELRTPLNAVLGWAQMLERGIIPPDRIGRTLELIRRNAEVQHQIVNDMLDVSAFITGRVRLALTQVPLNVPVEAACDSVAPATRAKGLSLHVSVPGIRVEADRMRLQQVFWNLLGNAVKFTPPGGTVIVSAVVETTTVTVSIRDTGEGIDPAFLPYVFDRFRQGADKTRGGLGLGLALVKQIVEAHGGRVSARSEGIGRGAEFMVTLPLRRTPA